MRAILSLLVAAVVLALCATPSRSFAQPTATISRAQPVAAAPSLSPAPALMVFVAPIVAPPPVVLAPVGAPPPPARAPRYLQKRALLL